MALFAPGDIGELRDAVATALAAEEPIEIVGGGSKRGLGRPLQTPHLLQTTRLTGIREYEPSELVLTAGAATPLAEIERILAENHQMLAFEPPDWRGLFGTYGSEPTIGGALACNLAGPRRIKAGAARDHFLGFRGVSGRAEIYKAGGKVVKNVTGYDLCKLIAGSHGTLTVLEEISIKVLPRPETAASLLFDGIPPAASIRLMAAALGSPHEVSGAVYLPAGAVAPVEGRASHGMVALRVEGPAPSVAFRCDALITDHRASGTAEILDEQGSAVFWRGIGNVSLLSTAGDRAIWRVSVAPSRGAEIAEAIMPEIDGGWFLDWGGGLLWVAMRPDGDGRAARIRAAVKGPDGRGTGHAALIKAPPALRQAIPVFEPEPAALAALSRRVKAAFDPKQILNPGRMGEGG